MRYFLFVLIFISAQAFAAGYGGASGDNKIGQDIHIVGEGYEELVIVIQKNEKLNLKEERYKFSPECSFSFDKKNEASKISCSRAGKSPLAGATYKITTSKEWTPCKNNELYPSDEAGTVYVCVKGCNDHTPDIFYEDPWEC